MIKSSIDLVCEIFIISLSQSISSMILHIPSFWDVIAELIIDILIVDDNWMMIINWYILIVDDI